MTTMKFGGQELPVIGYAIVMKLDDGWYMPEEYIDVTDIDEARIEALDWLDFPGQECQLFPVVDIKVSLDEGQGTEPGPYDGFVNHKNEGE